MSMSTPVSPLQRTCMRGKVTGAIFLDLKKALILLHVVIGFLLINSKNVVSVAMNSTGSNHILVRELLKIGSSLSNLKPINIGIPQGSIIGPLLFVFVNDLPTSVMCKTVMYTDNTSLLIISSSSDTQCLQNSLNHNLCNNCLLHGLQKMNLLLIYSKTKLMLFGASHNPN